jgi:adenosine deaminase
MKESLIDPTLPLIDLHRHLDGNIRLETILDLGRQHNLALPAWDVDELRKHVQVTEPQPGVMAFIAKFYWMIHALVDYDACRRVAYENVEDAYHEGLDYVELRFSPLFMAEGHGLDPDGVVEAVCDGVNGGQLAFGLPVNLIGIISRTYGPDKAWTELKSFLRQKDQITGLDLAGDEAHFPAELFGEHFKSGREAGWGITVHAGEIAGPESIWQAIHVLGARRIGHAVAAIHDAILMDYMVEHEIAIEGNLTSNVQTMTSTDYASHPLRFFLERGICVTLNTDDPGISGINLAYEYDVAAPAAGFSPPQIRILQTNALKAAFLSGEEKAALLAKKSGRPA